MTRWVLLSSAAALVAANASATSTNTTPAEAFSPPGVYGRIDPRPYPNVKLAPPSKKVQVKDRAATQYLWVPAGHRLQWPSYCARYRACDAPVQFVDEEWYFHAGPGQGLNSGHDHDHDHDH